MTLLAPALTSVREPAERVKAMSRCLRVLNAIQAQVEPGSDRVPELADLGLPHETTIDPYNGEPLQIKKLPERLAGLFGRHEPRRRWRHA